MLATATRTIRLAALAALLASSIAGGPGRAAAQGFDGDTFTDERYGWSVAWDDRTWQGTPVGPSHVVLQTSAAIATLRVHDGMVGADACVKDLGALYEDNDGYRGVAPAADLDLPDTAGDAEIRAYTADEVVGRTAMGGFVVYLECRPVTGATLSVEVVADRDEFDGFLPDLEALLAGISTEDASSDASDGQDDATPVADEGADVPAAVTNDVDAGELVGDTFTDSALGYSVTWDAAVWTNSYLNVFSPYLAETEDTAGVTLVADASAGNAVVFIDASGGYGGVDPQSCVDHLATGIGDIPDMSGLEPAVDLDVPDAPRGAAGTLYVYTNLLLGIEDERGSTSSAGRSATMR